MHLEDQHEWFSTWFNSPYYHLLYDQRDDEEAEAFIRELCSRLALNAGASVLDLACGAGRHSRVLHDLGYTVWGADLSPNSISEASKHAGEGLSFFVHDMRDPLPQVYDAIFNLFTSFGYFDTVAANAQVLRSVYNALVPGGILVIDFMNAERVVRELKPRQEIRKGDVVFHIKREVVNGRIVKTIAFEACGQSFFFQEKVQALVLVDFQTLLQDAGFSISNLYGNYNLDSFDPLTSDRLILICQKS